MVIPGIKSVMEIAPDSNNMLTSDEISCKPLHVIEGEPMNKGKEVSEVTLQSRTCRSVFLDPFGSSRLSFDIAVGAVDGKNRFASSDWVRTSLVTVIKFDTEYLGQAMANLGASRCHGWNLGRVGRGLKVQACEEVGLDL